MKIVFITQPGGMAKLTPDQIDALRADIRAQMTDSVPVVILPPGLFVHLLDVGETSPIAMTEPKPAMSGVPSVISGASSAMTEPKPVITPARKGGK